MSNDVTRCDECLHLFFGVREEFIMDERGAECTTMGDHERTFLRRQERMILCGACISAARIRGERTFKVPS